MPADVAEKEQTSPVQEFRLITAKEVQKILGIGKTTLYGLMFRKKDPIPSVKFKKSRRFRLDKLMWWIENQEQS